MSDQEPTSSNNARGWLTGGYDLPWPAEIGSLLIRLHFGFAIFWGAGISKFPLSNWFAGQVAELGFPMPTLFAWLAAMSEVAGGVLLVLGLCTRPAALFLSFTLAVAAFRFHGLTPLVSQHITQLYLWGFVFFLFAGSGRLSLDGLLRRKDRAAGIAAVVITACLSIYCGMRTADTTEQEAVADLSAVEAVTLAGSFNDWSIEDAPMTEAEPGVWTATVEVEAPSPVEFKFVGNESWELSAGEEDQSGERFPVSGVAEAGRNAANIEAYLPKAGVYEFRVALPSLEYSVSALEGDSAASDPVAAEASEAETPAEGE